MAEVMNIAALVRRTGVAAHTLRKWEERYGILHPARTPGGQRRYSELDVIRVEWLRDRLTEGYRIREAAALLGTSDTAVARTPAEFRDAIFGALVRVETDELDRMLEQAFTLFRLEETLAEIIAPVLERIGEAWADGEMSVAQEHLLSAAVRGRIDRLLAEAGGGPRGTAVLACTPGEQHELGLLMLAALLKADGWRVAYLGAATPFRDALALAERLSARVLCLSIGLAERVPELRKQVGMAVVPKGLRLVLGGGAATPELARSIGARHLNGNPHRAVRELRKLAT